MALFKVFSIPKFSIVSEVLRIPAVSIKRKLYPSIIRVSSIASLVVPAMSDTIALSSLSKRFSRVDFPTFVAPKIVTAIPFFMEFPNLKDCINFSNSDFNFSNKSLNCLLNEEKAIVSDIAGTTRDAIEDTLIIEGYNFRFIDTAGIRNTTDTIENLGIEKTLEKANKSEIILFIIDVSQELESQLMELKKIRKDNREKVLVIVNKIDVSDIDLKEDYIAISAKNEEGISGLKNKLLNFINTEKISENDSIVSNLRHYEQLQLTLHEINSIINGMQNNISGDFLSINIRQALFHLGSITGEVTTDDLLGNIFGKFCIGK